MTPHQYTYEILDDMECPVALADTLDDAQYAAEIHAAKLIYNRKTRKCIAIEKQTVSA